MELYDLKITYFTMNPDVRDDLTHTEIVYGKWDAKNFASIAARAVNVREVVVISALTGEIVYLFDGYSTVIDE